jgi:hypothetical protein
LPSWPSCCLLIFTGTQTQRTYKDNDSVSLRNTEELWNVQLRKWQRRRTLNVPHISKVIRLSSTWPTTCKSHCTAT